MENPRGLRPLGFSTRIFSLNFCEYLWICFADLGILLQGGLAASNVYYGYGHWSDVTVDQPCGRLGEAAQPGQAGHNRLYNKCGRLS